MNINLKCGCYFMNHLINFDLDLNVAEEYYKQLKKVLQIKRVKSFPFIRVGKANDGGYLMVDDLCERIAYSFGISNDVSWDNNMADFGYNIYMYDPTIEALPYERPEFHFFKEGLAGATITEKNMDTLENFIIKNNHTNKKHMILKIDIEGAEWDFLSTVKSSTLEQFDQILFEFHDMIKAKTEEEWQKTISLLEKINETHVPVHIHGNNCDSVITINNQPYPNALEVTYVNKSIYECFTDKTLKLPRSIDAPNDKGRPDIVLGKWNKI